MMWTVIGWVVAFSLGLGVGVWMRFRDEEQGVDR